MFKIFRFFLQFDSLREQLFSFLTENNSGIGASGYGPPGPTWDRGANLKDYYSRKEEQEVQAVRLSLSPFVTYPGLSLTTWFTARLKIFTA